MSTTTITQTRFTDAQKFVFWSALREHRDHIAGEKMSLKRAASYLANVTGLPVKRSHIEGALESGVVEKWESKRETTVIKNPRPGGRAYSYYRTRIAELTEEVSQLKAKGDVVDRVAKAVKNLAQQLGTDVDL